MSSVSEEQAERSCASCGAWWGVLAPLHPSMKEDLLCARCLDRMSKEGEGLRYWFPSGPVSPAAEFEELFRAARVLLKQQVTDEDQIIPTLWAAYQIAHGSERWVNIREEVDQCGPTRLRRVRTEGAIRRTEGPRNLRAFKVVDDVLLVEREPVSAEIVGGPLLNDFSLPPSIRWRDKPDS